MQFSYPNHLEDALGQLASDLANFAKKEGLSSTCLNALNLVLDEALTNSISYGLSKKDAGPKLELEYSEHTIKARFSDTASAFNPLEHLQQPDTKPLQQRRIGGLGVFFMEAMVDEVHYERKNSRNILTFIKKTSAADLKPARCNLNG